MHRGEVWWVEFPLQTGRRPAVLLTREKVINARGSVSVAPITRTIRNLGVEVTLSREDGLPEKCVANLDDIMTVHKSRVIERVTQLSMDKLVKDAKADNYALALGF